MCLVCVHVPPRQDGGDIYGDVAGSERLDLTEDPSIVITDFERAVTSAVELVLGAHIHWQGCFFYLTKCTWRKLHGLGLVRLYRDDAAARHFCGMLDSLAFLSLADVAAGIAHRITTRMNL